MTAPRSARRAAVLAASLALAVATACTAPPSAVTAPDQVTQGSAQVDAANDSVARQNLASAQREAQTYATLNDGSMAGFAAASPALASTLERLDDSTAVARVGPGRCLTAALPDGPVNETPC